MNDNTDDTIRILEGAVDSLQAHGWIQLDYGSKERGFCLAGAIGTARRGLGLTFNEEVDAKIAVSGILRATSRQVDHHDHSTTCVECWNDKLGRTSEEVIDVLQETIKDLRSRA